MQENCTDFYEEEYNKGCCLKCFNSYAGCLCKEYKCTQCHWYSSPTYYLNAGKGICDKKGELKSESKNRWIEEMRNQGEIKSKQLEELKKLNEITENEIKKENGIANHYSCQRCGIEFVSKEDLFIIISKQPFCFICKEELKIMKLKEN